MQTVTFFNCSSYYFSNLFPVLSSMSVVTCGPEVGMCLWKFVGVFWVYLTSYSQILGRCWPYNFGRKEMSIGHICTSISHDLPCRLIQPVKLNVKRFFIFNISLEQCEIWIFQPTRAFTLAATRSESVWKAKSALCLGTWKKLSKASERSLLFFW